VRFGDEHVEAIEIIGYDAASGTRASEGEG
jgi:hypothetical protein